MSGKVTFDSNMMNLSFEPVNLKAAELRLNNLFQSDNKTTLFVSVGNTSDEGLQHYAETNRELETLKTEGKIKEFASAEKYLFLMQNSSGVSTAGTATGQLNGKHWSIKKSGRKPGNIISGPILLMTSLLFWINNMLLATLLPAILLCRYWTVGPLQPIHFPCLSRRFV